MEVTIYELNEHAEDVVTGTLRWSGRRFTLTPENPNFLDWLLSTDAVTEDRKTFISSDADPVKWMKNLHRRISGAYMRASQAVEIS